MTSNKSNLGPWVLITHLPQSITLDADVLRNRPPRTDSEVLEAEQKVFHCLQCQGFGFWDDPSEDIYSVGERAMTGDENATGIIITLESEIKRLKTEILDIKADYFFDMAYLVPEADCRLCGSRPQCGETRAGWWDAGARSSVKQLGDDLVAAGRFERHPDGYGRRWFYRPVAAPAAPAAPGPEDKR